MWMMIGAVGVGMVLGFVFSYLRKAPVTKTLGWRTLDKPMFTAREFAEKTFQVGELEERLEELRNRNCFLEMRQEVRENLAKITTDALETTPQRYILRDFDLNYYVDGNRYRDLAGRLICSMDLYEADPKLGERLFRNHKKRYYPHT